MTDDCDPATFNEALRDEKACVIPGDTTFEDFLTQFMAEGTVDKWEFKSDEFHVDAGDVIKAVNTGGEFHTFTEVSAFDGGCVPELNRPGQSPAPQCTDPTVFGRTGIPSGGTVRVPASGERPLEPGTHKFQCMIHPWMQTTVQVRR